jgi:ABC-2 type transport system ATP-binding protein
MISLRNVTRVFGDFVAVDGITLKVPRGAIFGFLGTNGAGKTTTIRMMTTTLAPSSGSISLNGHDVVQFPGEARRMFGIVFQDPSLDIELTAYENMTLHSVLYGMSRALRDQRIPELLRFVGLWDQKDAFPKTFSGGMKRRLEIARSLLHAPAILFLDEPTLGLDPQTRSQVWGYLKWLALKEHTTVFFTTHYMEEAERVADTIAIIDRGKLIAMASPSALCSKTSTGSLEEAFIKLTDRSVEEGAEAASSEIMRTYTRVWGR